MQYLLLISPFLGIKYSLQLCRKKALAVTGGGGVEQAMEWLLAHADDPGINDPPAEDVTGAAAGHSLGQFSAVLVILLDIMTDICVF